MEHGRKLTADQQAALLVDIEKACLAGKWSLDTQRDLAEKYDVGPQAIARHRHRYDAIQRASVTGETMEERRTGWWLLWSEAFDVARKAGDCRGMERLLGLRARVLQMEHAPISSPQQVDVTVTAVDPRIASLTDDELLRLVERDGTWAVATTEPARIEAEDDAP